LPIPPVFFANYFEPFMKRIISSCIASCCATIGVISATAMFIEPDDDRAAKPVKIDVRGLHNVLQIGDRLFSGSGPEGEESFHSLQKLGIKTIISVDGAKPDLVRARMYGMRYVHIPIGYNGLPRSAALQLARAVRELPGPFYVHCHHGKHRGPTAAAVALMCMDRQCTVSHALRVLESAGTDPRYKGLFQSVREFERPDARELGKGTYPLLEVVAVTGIVQAMVTIDHSFDNIKLVQAARWKAPKDHPDIDPPHEALQLLEGFQELGRLREVDERPADFRQWLADAYSGAQALEELLRDWKDEREAVSNQADTAFKRISLSCVRCHAKYRDNKNEQNR
jgi:protein tyrosine phosphatase (PTP) superfamily phosphohydrolase (DUF442 family)